MWSTCTAYLRPPHSLLILWQHFGFLSSWVRPLLEAIFFSDRRFQNRYFPMTWQFWQITGQCLVFPPGPRGILTVAHKISFICSAITNYQRGEFIRPSTALYFCSRQGYELHCCQGHSSLDAPSELNPPQRIPSPLFVALLVPQAEG